MVHPVSGLQLGCMRVDVWMEWWYAPVPEEPRDLSACRLSEEEEWGTGMTVVMVCCLMHAMH